MKSSKIILNIENLWFKYPAGFEIREINFKVVEGTFNCLIGPNGSGKTTLLKLLGGILIPARGKIKINGKDLSSLSLKQKAHQLAYIPQFFQSNLPFTVEQIISMGRYPHLRGWGFLDKQDHHIIFQNMELLKITHLLGRYFNSLSGGEKQKVLIATALTQCSNLLLLDEPASSLDIHFRNEIYSILKDLTGHNSTVVMVSHDLSLASLYSDKLILLDQGRLSAQGSSSQVIDQENLVKVFNRGFKIIWSEQKPLVIPQKI
ncbi:MAG: ABC transporter ATP-binding protein [bacterium]